MQLFSRILISLAVAAVAWALISFLPGVPVAAALFGATIVTALLTSIPVSAPAGSPAAAATPAAAPTGDRETGSVKWFNVSKGFGFITKENGEEIFVHFRSIRGDGHRSLRDGQRVSFVEAQTDKGPQAEDVEPL